MTRYYWWLQLAKDVQEYVKGCAQCQQNKANTHPQKAPLNPNTPTMGALPFQTISMDFIMKLPELARYDSILTITDHDVVDDFSYICLDKGKRKLVYVIDGSKHNAETSHMQHPKQ